jgi:hypothetical protein
MMLQDFFKKQRILVITRNRKPDISRTRRENIKKIQKKERIRKVEEGIGENEIQRRLIYKMSDKRCE